MMSQSQSHQYTCPCCGYPGLKSKPYAEMPHPLSASLRQEALPPYEDLWGMGSYEVCSCCGYEFGHDDNPGMGRPISFVEHLQEWVEADGQSWFAPEDKPKGWSLEAQLSQAGYPLPSAKEDN